MAQLTHQNSGSHIQGIRGQQAANPHISPSSQSHRQVSHLSLPHYGHVTVSMVKQLNRWTASHTKCVAMSVTHGVTEPNRQPPRDTQCPFSHGAGVDIWTDSDFQKPLVIGSGPHPPGSSTCPQHLPSFTWLCVSCCSNRRQTEALRDRLRVGETPDHYPTP